MNKTIINILLSISILAPNSLFAKDDLKSTKLAELLTRQKQVLEVTKYNIFQFWASWCVGCAKSMLRIDEAFNFPKKHVNYLSVGIDETYSAAMSYFKFKWLKDPKSLDFTKTKLKNVRKHYWDPTLKLHEKLGNGALPYLVLTNKAGDILYKRSGVVKKKQVSSVMNELKNVLKKDATAQKSKHKKKKLIDEIAKEIKRKTH